MAKERQVAPRRVSGRWALTPGAANRSAGTTRPERCPHSVHAATPKLQPSGGDDIANLAPPQRSAGRRSRGASGLDPAGEARSHRDFNLFDADIAGCSRDRRCRGRENSKQHNASKQRQQISDNHQEQEPGVPGMVQMSHVSRRKVALVERQLLTQSIIEGQHDDYSLWRT